MTSLATCQLPDGAELGYCLYGDKRSGLPVVLLNGILMNYKSWGAQASAISKRNPVLSYDLRGQLHSTWEAGGRTLESHAEDLCHLLRGLGIERCHLAGTSFGGEVGLAFAHRYPAMAASLTVIASVSYSDALLKRQVGLWQALAGQPELLFEAVATTAYSPSYLQAQPHFLAQRKQAFAQLPPLFFQAFESLCEQFCAFHFPDTALSGIACPALIVSAGADLLKPSRYSRHIARQIPGALYWEVPGAGHAVVAEQPQTITQLICAFVERGELPSENLVF